MKKEIELYRRNDGFYAGREKKDGSLGADAHKVTAEEIMTIMEFFTDYCNDTGTSKLLMQDGEGRLFVTMRVPDKPKADKPQARRDSGKKPIKKTTKPKK